LAAGEKVNRMRIAKEYQKQAEDGRDKVRRDLAGVTEILRCIAEEASDREKGEIEKAREILKKIAEDTIKERAEGTTRWLSQRGQKGAATAIEFAIDSRSVVSREFGVSDFTNVEVDCAFLFEITRSDTHRAVITASEKLFDYINVTKSGNTLKLSLKPIRFHTCPTLRAAIAMPALRKLRQSAATKGVVRGFRSQEPFVLNLSGASTLDIDIEAGDTRFEISGASKVSGNTRVRNAEITLSGASRAELRGSANNVILNAWGATNLDLTAFVIDSTTVYLKGASQATINVTNQLDVDLSGSSRLDYLGHPNLHEISLSGASTLHQR
jgi:hypothetical protein